MFFLKLYLAYYTLTLAICFHQLAFDDFKINIEQKVKNISKQMARVYATRCTNQIFLNCSEKSYDFCQGTGEHRCLQTFPKPNQCNGNLASFSAHSAVRFAKAKNHKELTQSQRAFICSSALIENHFQHYLIHTHNQYTFTYIGDKNGLFRINPSFRQRTISEKSNFCREYDPRVRPWYSAGFSNAKNIVILAPMTGTIQTQKLLKIMQTVLITILSTFSNNDFFNIITYNSTTTLLNQNFQSLKRATQENINDCIQLINSLNSPQGLPNYANAFYAAFNVLEEAVESNAGAPCRQADNIIIFIADDQPKQGQRTFDTLKTIIDSRNQKFNSIFITKSLPSNFIAVYNPLLKKIACSYQGFFIQIPRTNITTIILQKLYQVDSYFQKSKGFDNLVWTYPYTDFFGYGRILTVTAPIYATEMQDRQPIGVAGIDVPIKALIEAFDFMSEEQITEQLTQTVICSDSANIRQNPCILERIRSEDSKCQHLGFPGYESCPSIIQNECHVAKEVYIFKDPIMTQRSICCSDVNKTMIIIASVSGAVFLFVVLIPIFLILRKLYKKKKIKSSQNGENHITDKKRVEQPIETQRNFYPADGQLVTSEFKQKILRGASQFGLKKRSGTFKKPGSTRETSTPPKNK